MNTLKLTPEKFAEIYTSEKFRNEVAYAHGCVYEGIPEYRETCSYPVRYVVTPEQIAEAQKEIERAKKQAIKDNEGKLLFVGMGCAYEPRYKDDVCNHRIRTEFTNENGHRFFIELGTGQGEQMRIDHAIDRDKEILHDANAQKCREQREQVQKYSHEWNALTEEIEKWNRQSYYNYKGLERKNNLPKYTLRNVLYIVNHYFDCHFKEIIIDNYNLSTDDFTAVSPSQELQTV